MCPPPGHEYRGWNPAVTEIYLQIVMLPLLFGVLDYAAEQVQGFAALVSAEAHDRGALATSAAQPGPRSGAIVNPSVWSDSQSSRGKLAGSSAGALTHEPTLGGDVQSEDI
jgi:hypothetical protein